MLEPVACLAGISPYKIASAAEYVALALFLFIVVNRRLPLALGLLFPVFALAFQLWVHLPRNRFPEALVCLVGGTTVLMWGICPPIAWLAGRLLYSLPGRLSRESADSDGKRGATLLLQTTAELGRLGFRSVGRLFVGDGMERQARTYFLDETGTILVRRTIHWIGATGLSFISEQDGARVTTSNWSRIQPWPVKSGSFIHYHHFCKTAEELLRKHRQHLAEHSIDAPNARCDSDVLAHECRRFEEDMDEVIRIGSLFRDRQGRLRLTLKGTYGALWRGLFVDFRHKHLQLGG